MKVLLCLQWGCWAFTGEPKHNVIGMNEQAAATYTTRSIAYAERKC